MAAGHQPQPRGGLGWMLGDSSSQQWLQSPGMGCPGQRGSPIPGNVQETWMWHSRAWPSDLGGAAGQLDWVILESFSRLSDSMTPWLTGRVSSVSSGSRSSKTFKPKKNIPEGSHQYELLKHAEATLGSGNLRQAVMLPEGEDLNEWIAVNTVDFFNQINMLYGTITEFCTESSCPVMSAGPRYEYHWADGTNIKKPIKCSAPKYIDYLMTWVQDQLDDETLFPSKIGVPFPKNFMSVAKTILKRLFRVYAHIYHQHFDSVIRLQEEAHLNTSFKHFIFFVQEFNLIDRRELAPLQELIEKLGSKDR
ncbi:MOB kinase activator 1A isoform X1 [Pipra filicauda]|uniref:MOB kinase activator 1A isoform X1 n=4 Tax=Pipridae TaxID=114313 RepID=A0A6J2HYS1_9PASS|nr:MOB kinase activator 1A isoform X1 [Pipra filicauda]